MIGETIGEVQEQEDRSHEPDRELEGRNDKISRRKEIDEGHRKIIVRMMERLAEKSGDAEGLLLVRRGELIEVRNSTPREADAKLEKGQTRGRYPRRGSTDVVPEKLDERRRRKSLSSEKARQDGDIQGEELCMDPEKPNKKEAEVAELRKARQDVDIQGEELWMALDKPARRRLNSLSAEMHIQYEDQFITLKVMLHMTQEKLLGKEAELAQLRKDR